MRKHLNTLFVTTQHAYLHKEGESVVVKVNGENRLRIPVHTLDGIVCFGAVSISPFLMFHCASSNVTISFMSEHGKFLARIHGPITGNVLLRREQYRMADLPEQASKIATNLLLGKLANSRAVLRRTIRDHTNRMDTKALQTAEMRLTGYLKQLKRNCSLDELRGIEGDAASVYFGVFDCLIMAQREEFNFKSRNRRPPLDPVNALISFVYTLLVHDCRSALEGVGLDPYVGYLHVDRPGRPSLALDIMEEFRSFLADRLVLSLINRRQINIKDFRKSESGAILLNDEGRKKVLVAWQKRKQDELTHPFTNEKIKTGLLTHMQARLLSRHLRGDLDGYPPFIWK